MLDPFSKFPANRTSLARIGGVNVRHGQPGTLRFVGDKLLQLPESPSMQSSPDSLSSLDVGADMGQVFHSDFTGPGTDSFCNDGLARFVVRMLHMPLLTTRDSTELAFSSPATVGLKTTTMGKVFVAVVPQLSAAPDLAGAGSREVGFPHVNPQSATAGYRRNIGNVEDEIEVPDAFADNEPGFLGCSAFKQVALMLAASEGDALPAFKGEQGKRVALDRIGALVEVNGRWVEDDMRNRLIFSDSLVSLKRLVGIRNAVNSLTNHLAAKRRKQFTHRVVSQVMQSYTIPAAMLLRVWNDCIAGIRKSVSQSRQRLRLLRCCQQLQGYGALHIGQFIGENTTCQA